MRLVGPGDEEHLESALGSGARRVASARARRSATSRQLQPTSRPRSRHSAFRRYRRAVRRRETRGRREDVGEERDAPSCSSTSSPLRRSRRVRAPRAPRRRPPPSSPSLRTTELPAGRRRRGRARRRRATARPDLVDAAVQLVVDCVAHSSGSTKTSISPPQVRPIPSAHVVGDPVRDESRRTACEHVLRGEVDVAFDAPSGDGARELAARGAASFDPTGRGEARRVPRRSRSRPVEVPLRPPAIRDSPWQHELT